MRIQRRRSGAPAAVLIIALCTGLVVAGLYAASPAPQAAKKSAQTDKEKQKQAEDQKKAEEKKKEDEKKGGLFGGMKREAGLGRTEERRASVSTGAKGAQPVGSKVASHSPTSTDRSRLATMEAAKPGKEEMAKFIQEGKLNPQKGGGS